MLILKFVEAEDIFRFKKAVFNYEPGLTGIVGENKDVAVSTSNGAGKSAAACEILAYALFGKTIRGIDGDKVLSPWAKSGRAVAVFDQDGKPIRIERTRTRGRKTMLTIEGSVLQFDRLKDTQAQVERLLGFNFETFCHSIAFGQKTARFLRLADAEKKAVIDGVMGVSIFERACDVAREEEKLVMADADQAASLIKLAEARKREIAIQSERAHSDAAERERRRAARMAVLEQVIQSGPSEADLKSKINEVERADLIVVQVQKELVDAQGYLTQARTNRETADVAFHNADRLLTDADKRAAQLSFELQQTQKAAEKLAGETDQAKAAISETRQKLTTVQALLVQAKTKHEAADAAHHNADRLLTDHEKKVSQLSFELKQARKTAERLVGEIDAVKALTGLCPTCYQPITAECVGHALKVKEPEIASVMADMERLEKEEAESVIARDAGRKAATEAQSQKTAAMQRALTAERDVSRVETELRSQVDAAQESQIASVTADMRKLEKDEAAAILVRDAARKNAAEAQGHKTTAAQCSLVVERDVAQVEGQLRNHMQAAQEARRACDLLSDRVRIAREAGDEKARFELEKTADAADIQDKDRRLADCDAEIEKARAAGVAAVQRSQDAAFWAEGFGLRGIRSLMLDAVLPFIESRANDYLDGLTAGTVKIAISSVRELQHGDKLKDAISVVISSPVSGEFYEQLSAGEAQRIDIPVALGIFDLARMRSGVDIGVVIFDEIFEHIDDAGCFEVAHLLRKVSPSFGCTVVVTHKEALLRDMPKIIKVVKEDGVSRIEAA